MLLKNFPTASIVELLNAQLPDLAGIYLFGSYAADNATAVSDIDLALLPTCKLATMQLWQTAQALASLIDKTVDLIDLWQASTVLRWQIVDTGRLIFCRTPAACASFETLALSAYIRFNEERAEILQAISQTGRIYHDAR